MNKRTRKKQLNRAAPLLTPQYAPGGATMYVPPSYQQSILGQTYYGSSLKNIPVGQTALFSPGLPLPTQPNVNPQGLPVQYRFPVAVNTFPVDRTQGQPDIPSFEQLRRLARMYSGITLCERYWLDLVPRMKLDVKLKKMYKDQGAEEKNYQKEIAFFKTFFEKPDGRLDQHSWIRKALREQTQIDELYLYKHRTRGKKLLGLWIVDGAQMKPLLDDWGMTPDAPDYAYQQYPWGIPGMMYSTDQMIHYQESPATDTPYGFSRVERIILEVNQALRKKRKDLANFTEGNIPQSFMEVPESSNWTPDQIDAYEQSWNALLAGNSQQQVRIKFLQPGMKYISAEQYELLPDFDKFLLNISVATYGISMAELSFTENVNRSSGESQEDMIYRRTIGPLATMYGLILTDVMGHDFPPEMHGEMFEAVFTGYEELEDENEKADALTKYTQAGILGLTAAAKLAGLPEDPKATPIGRVMVTKNGPLFLDDKEIMDAQKEATLAGYQMAANPPEPEPTDEEEPKPGQNPDKDTGNEKSDDKMERVLARIETLLRTAEGRNEQRTQPRTEDETRSNAHLERTDGSVARTGAQSEDLRVTPSGADRAKPVHQEYRRWREKAIKAISSGKPCTFTSELIPADEYQYITAALQRCTTADEVRAVFDRAREQERPLALASTGQGSNSGGSQPSNKSNWKLRW